MSFYYADDDEIAGKCFDGETIPSDNTVTSDRLTFVKDQAQRETNRAAGLDQGTEDDDDTGILKKVFLKYCELEFDKKELKLPDYLIQEIADSQGVPLVIFDPPTGRN